MKRFNIAFPYLLFTTMALLVVWSNTRSAPENLSPVNTESEIQIEKPDPNICPPCGMTVADNEGFEAEIDGRIQRFCSEGCKESYLEKRLAVVSTATNNTAKTTDGTNRLFDPVCQMEVNPAWGFSFEHQNETYYFCTKRCRESFAEQPDRYTSIRCLVCQQNVHSAEGFPATYMGYTYLLCTEEHRVDFKNDPARFFLHRMWGIPDWLYYSSIALILMVSYMMFEGKTRLRRMWRSAPVSESASKTSCSDRIDLMRFSPVRSLLLSRPFRFMTQSVMVIFFVLIVAAGLFGNQNPALNIAPLLTWTIWWCGLVVLILFAGKAWCYMCPWDAIASWMEKLRFWKKGDGLGLGMPWPRVIRNISLAIILFIILTWIELGFGVTMRPQITAYLAIAMLVLAIVSAFLFERKSFCRYGCLIGRISGLYALFSGIEIRHRETNVCTSCRGKACITGNDSAYGCPTFEYPGTMKINTYCIQCAECLQACPHDNLSVNLRPWGTDLAAEGKPRTDEAYLALLMLSITAFHGLTMTPVWNDIIQAIQTVLSLDRIAAFSLGMTGLLGIPILIYAVLVWLSYRISQNRSQGALSISKPGISYHDYFIRYAYCLLPIALFYHLAHNLEHLLMEGPKIVTLLSDPFGWGWNLFGTVGLRIPPMVSLDVLWLLQVLLVGVGHVYSLWVAQKISRRLFSSEKQAWWGQLPMLAAMIAFSFFSLWLLKLPMEMRTSAM